MLVVEDVTGYIEKSVTAAIFWIIVQDSQGHRGLKAHSQIVLFSSSLCDNTETILHHWLS